MDLAVIVGTSFAGFVGLAAWYRERAILGMGLGALVVSTALVWG